MLIFTLKARRAIEQAVNTYGDDRQRGIWRSWTAEHTAVRRGPADPFDDGKGPMPAEVASVVHSALHQMFQAIKDGADRPGITEDDLAEISNDLSFIQSIVRTLPQEPAGVEAGQNN